MGGLGCSFPCLSLRDAEMATPAEPSFGGAAESPGACGPAPSPLRAAALAAGGYLSPDYVSQRLLPGLHMLHAAPGASRQLPARRPLRRKASRCGSRCGSRRCSRCDRRGSRGSHRGGCRRFPVQLPARFPERLPAGHPPGAPSGAPGRAPPPAPARAIPGTPASGRQHAPRASLDAGGGQQPAVAGGGLGGGRAAHGLHVATQRGALAGDLPGSGGGRLRAQRGPVPLQVEGAQAGFPLGAGDAPQGRTPLAPAAAALPSHEEHLEGGRAARLWRAEDARRGEAALQKAQVSPCHTLSILTRATRARRWRGRPQDAAVTGAAVCEGRARESPSLLCSVAARCSAAAAFQPRGGCIAVVAGGEHIAGVPPTPPAMPHTGCCFSPLSQLGCHTDLKQEGAEGKASFPGETSLGMGRGNRVLPLAAAATGSHGTAAMSEQPAAGEDASDTSLHGSGVAGLLQNVQQLLVQILQTSRQQQALLESLASDTVSHLHLLSHSLVQVGETLHQLLLRPQTHPGPIGHYVPHVPLFERGSGVPCSPGAPHTSPDHKEEPQMSPDARCIPP
ncbi:collagen alpha-1(I) chain-like isoform X2 [Pyrgilauda ruficollis]|uniref:collagen alpha-1(I) chain-like isoform X2 n=1 Tax=Pyrgilauda ruficollis TaxID=221976 RepID=UPI001B878B64|nr:collagen alpha-1(I) chain-like isoform X2 [Pyrgilauda ruficollis]